MAIKYTKGSFIVVPNKDGLRGMKPAAQVLFMWLCSYANVTGKCFPSKKKLAEDCGMSESAVLRAIADLITSGHVLKTIRKEKGGRNQSNVYTVLLGGGGCHTDTHGCQADTGGGCQADALTQSRDELNPLNSTFSQGEKKPPVLETDFRKAIDAFAPVNGAFIRFYRLKTQREATKNLIRRFGIEKLLQIISALHYTNGKVGAPIITTPDQLEIKVDAFLAYYKKEIDKQRGRERGIII